MNYNNHRIISIVSFFMLGLSGCSEKKLDFMTMKKIDAHVHIRYNGLEFLDQAMADNFRVISILVDNEDIARQQKFIEKQIEKHPEQIAFITTFTVQGWEESDWQEKTIAHLKKAFQEGAIAVKVWKNIGMELRDKDGKFVMIDHPRFDPIFDFIESQGKTLTGHIGEPRDCWLPLDEMMGLSNRDYYQNHPQYHMYLHPEYPTYEEQIKSYEHVLEKHPDLRYVGCHLGSIEWSMEELAKRLDRYPNMAVDLAERIDDIQLLDTDEIRDFFNQYQDRILYGTDLNIKESDDPKAYSKYAHNVWMRDWNYFSTDSLMNIPGVDKPVHGLDLSTTILEKIYRINTEKWYPDI